MIKIYLSTLPWSTEAGEIIIARSGDGHFYIDGLVNNVKIKFMVDTGASDVALTSEDAKKLGFDLKKLKYTRTYLTAIGENKAAPMMLNSVIIGKEFKDVGGHMSVLAILIFLFLVCPVLERFKGFKIDKALLILNYQVLVKQLIYIIGYFSGSVDKQRYDKNKTGFLRSTE